MIGTSMYLKEDSEELYEWKLDARNKNVHFIYSDRVTSVGRDLIKIKG